MAPDVQGKTACSARNVATPDCKSPVGTGLLDALQRLKRGSKTHESAEVDSNDIRSWYDWFQDHVVVVNDLNAIVRLVVKTVSKREISRIKRERGDFATEAEVATKLRLKLNREPAEEDKDLLIGEENSFQLANDSDHVLVEICGGWKLLRRGHVLVLKS